MTVLTDDGVEVFVLPDCAKCTASGNANPFDIDACPLNGEEKCEPDNCPYYTED